MKHHVILLVDSLLIPGTFVTREYNLAGETENDIPEIHLSEEAEKLTYQEIRPYLATKGFIERQFSPPANGVELDPELMKEIGGSSSFIEIVLSGVAIITMFFFKSNGLPRFQRVFELQLPDE